MTKHIVKEQPGVLEAGKILKKGIKNKSLIVITACCKVSYEGRAKSELGLVDRVILLKADVSFLIHQNKKREPVNWQPPGCKVKYEIQNKNIILKSIREKPFETLKVELSKIYMITYFLSQDDENLD